MNRNTHKHIIKAVLYHYLIFFKDLLHHRNNYHIIVEPILPVQSNYIIKNYIFVS